MSDLRERLLDLSAVMCDSGHGDEFDRKCLALAAARMALEDAARLCNVTRGEMTAEEWRTVSAILLWRQRTIRAAAGALK